MKNLFKNTISGYILAVGLVALQISCSNNKTPETSTTTFTTSGESDAAYTDYKNYVSSIDTTATDTADSSWMEQRRMYNEKLARVDQYNADYDKTRQQEISQLKSRYSTYRDSRATTRSGGMATAVAEETTVTGTDMMAAFNPANITATTPLAIRRAYEEFVNNVQAHKEMFTKADWEKVSAYNKALDDRKNSMQSQLSDKDKYEIGKAKAKYTALKAGEKLDPDVSKAAADVKQTGSNVKDKVGTAAKNTAADVDEASQKVSEKAGNTVEKVGHAAKETGKDVKNATIKGAKAVGNTAEKAGEKVKNFFDGDKKKE